MATPLRIASLIMLSIFVIISGRYQVVRAQAGAGISQSEFLVEDKMEYAFPQLDTTTRSAQVTVMVYSRDKEIDSGYLRIVAVQSPDGAIITNTPGFGIHVDKQKVTSQGTPYVLKLPVDAFLRPGKYQVTLVLTNTSAPSAPEKRVTVVINYPQAEINFDELKDRSIELIRGKSGTERFFLVETTGRADLKELKYYCYLSGAKLTTDQIEVKPVDNTGALPTLIKAGEKQRLSITFPALDEVGRYSPQLIIRSPSMVSDKIIPLKLVVSDSWVKPLFWILVGVATGFISLLINERWRPRLFNRYRITRLRGEIDIYHQKAKALLKRTTLFNLRNELRDIEQQNEEGEHNAARQRLEKLSEQWAGFLKDEAKARAEAWQRLAAARALAQELLALPDLSELDKKIIDEVKAALNEGEQMLIREELDDAISLLAANEGRMAKLREQRLTKALTRMQTEWRQIAGVYQDEGERINGLFMEIGLLIAAGGFELAEQKLIVARQALDALPTRVKAGRPIDELGVHTLTPLTAPAAVIVPPLQLIVKQLPEKRLSNTDIEFELLDPQGVVKNGDRVEWDFGDQSAHQFLTLRQVHRYEKAGPYEAKVKIWRGQELKAQLTYMLIILPGHFEQARQEIRRSIRITDVALLGISAVLAILIGLSYFEKAKPFGTTQDYIAAFVWGFGVDLSVRSVSGILNKIFLPESKQ